MKKSRPAWIYASIPRGVICAALAKRRIAHCFVPDDDGQTAESICRLVRGRLEQLQLTSTSRMCQLCDRIFREPLSDERGRGDWVTLSFAMTEVAEATERECTGDPVNLPKANEP